MNIEMNKVKVHRGQVDVFELLDVENVHSETDKSSTNQILLLLNELSFETFR